MSCQTEVKVVFVIHAITRLKLNANMMQIVCSSNVEVSTLREQVKKLEALVVMRCDLDVPPQFSQGLQSHEVLEPVTAEHCQWFVAEIEKLRKERDEYKSGFEAAASKYRNLKLQMQEIINVC